MRRLQCTKHADNFSSQRYPQFSKGRCSRQSHKASSVVRGNLGLWDEMTHTGTTVSAGLIWENATDT